jgi:hypothetical protein
VKTLPWHLAIQRGERDKVVVARDHQRQLGISGGKRLCEITRDIVETRLNRCYMWRRD